MNTKIVEIKGFKIHTRIDKSTQDMAVINEVIGGDTYGLEKQAKIIHEPKAILDTGGHIGTFGLLAKRYWPEALLIAIEPNFISYLLYCKNMQENNCKNYYILNKAVGYGSKLTFLLEEKSTTGGGHIFRSREDLEDSLAFGYRITYKNIPVITIEEIIRIFDLDKIELSKWDCEGGEINIFGNISQEAASIFGYMAGEYHILGQKGEHLKGDGKKYLEFWETTKAKFPHLKFEFPVISGPLGQFKAYLKEV